MTRLLLSIAALLALMSADALAGDKKLTGPEIKAAYSDAKTIFTNSGGTWLVVWKADGTMTGIRKNKEDFPDKGKWWVKGDTFCREWGYWMGGIERCFGVTLDGEIVKWWRTDGSQSTHYRSFTLTK